MLKLEKVSSGYGKIDVLHGISMEVHEGEVVALIGANGAGKTTCLRTISGLIPVHNGELTFYGKSLKGKPSHHIVKAGISMCPEGRRIFPRMSVRENLQLGGYVRRGSPAALRQSMDEVFQLFPRLAERESQMAGTLSGGEQQMLALGRALMADPKLLLLDEPSLGLAPTIVQEMFRMIDKIHAAGKTILLVEQNAHQALQHSHRAYIIQNGSLIIEGNTSDLLRDERVVAAYLGLSKAQKAG